ncbi:hypothetical protein CSV79_15570 [Sporosarcina sp. P13]|nr:hypothetical protein CSV79_15570 [Sporosarcina sp. P13]
MWWKLVKTVVNPSWSSRTEVSRFLPVVEPISQTSGLGNQSIWVATRVVLVPSIGDGGLFFTFKTKAEDAVWSRQALEDKQ